jgi:hypothetical protein
MACIKVLKRTISRTKRQIAKQEGKLIYSESLLSKIEAKEEIERLKRKLLRVEQALILESARVEYMRGR